jgi:fatty-acyl-CoA synthase
VANAGFFAQLSGTRASMQGEHVTEKADSYVCGTADVPLLSITIGRSLDHAARRRGDRAVLVSPSHGVRWT